MSEILKSIKRRIQKMKSWHPSDEMLDDYLKNKLDPKNERRIDGHLFECFSCYERVMEKKDLIDGLRVVFSPVIKPYTKILERSKQALKGEFDAEVKKALKSGE